MSLPGLRLFILAVLLGVCTAAEAQSPAISARPLPIDPERPELRSLGALHYRGGLQLSSEDPRFGGLSGLVVTPDGGAFLALGDAGSWVSAKLLYSGEGQLSGVAEVRIGALLGENGEPLAGSKRLADAEAAALAHDGRLLVAFEREHRILAYSLEDLAPVGAPERYETAPHPDGSNGGTEGLAVLPDGRLLAFSERLRGEREGRITRLAFLAQRPGAPWEELDLALESDLAPVDAAALPGGDVLLLERRWSPFPGLSIRLSRIPGEALHPGALVEPQRLALLAPPLNIDNMEALAVRQDEEGRILVYLLSDDNFNPLQRTLLLLFELGERAD